MCSGLRVRRSPPRSSGCCAEPAPRLRAMPWPGAPGVQGAWLVLLSRRGRGLEVVALGEVGEQPRLGRLPAQEVSRVRAGRGVVELGEGGEEAEVRVRLPGGEGPGPQSEATGK